MIIMKVYQSKEDSNGFDSEVEKKESKFKSKDTILN